MKKRITIDAEDISLGIPGSKWACALAMALRRMFPTMEPSVSVIHDADGNGQYMVFLHEYVGGIQPALELRHVFSLSRNANAWIRKFDKTGTAEPGTFEMTAVEFERN